MGWSVVQQYPGRVDRTLGEVDEYANYGLLSVCGEGRGKIEREEEEEERGVCLICVKNKSQALEGVYY